MLLTRWLGVTTAYLLYSIPAGAGLLIQWRRYPPVRETWRLLMEVKPGLSRAERMRIAEEQEWGQRLFELQRFWLTAGLLLIPGVISHIAAFYLLIRPLRR